MSSSVDPARRSRLHVAPLIAAAVFVGQLVGLGLLFKHVVTFQCYDIWPDWACAAPNGILVSAYCMLGVAILYGMLRGDRLLTLCAQTGARLWPLLINGAGFALALVPALWLSGGADTSVIAATFATWALAAVLMAVGAVLFLAPVDRWAAFLKSEAVVVIPALAFGALAPSAALALQPLWHLDGIASMTFAAVEWSIGMLGYDVLSDRTLRIIGTYDFAIDVAPACSGIEGIALVLLFVTIYLALFRKELRFPRALLLYPIGIVASVMFNIVRITVLLAIGLDGNPELAVGGFHSHAGWMMFTIVALAIIMLAQSVPALQRVSDTAAETAREAAPLLPFWRDPAMAAIVPFAVFMLTAIPVAAFSATPGVVYPLRVAILGAVMLGFWAIYRALPWRASPVAIGAGAVIAAYWVLIPVAPGDGTAAYGTLTGVALIGWFVMRGLGTMVLVPMLEEMFFRQYLHRLIASFGTGKAWFYLAIILTAALFAVLHDRWAEAFVAGLIFSWVAYRKGGTIVDAIVSHAVANALIFAVAVATGRLEMI